MEDALLVALNTEAELTRMGYDVVGIAASITDTLDQLDEHATDVALLDVSLRGQHVRPIADALRDRGIPFVYTTGYAGILKEVDGISDAPVLSKPYSVEQLH